MAREFFLEKIVLFHASPSTKEHQAPGSRNPPLTGIRMHTLECDVNPCMYVCMLLEDLENLCF
jgi:hypothetical protein